MSKVLDELEKIAKSNCITDNDRIDRIIKHMLTLPFSYFQKDEGRYKYLCDDLCKGFKISLGDTSRISMEDVLLLIGYEPGNSYFDSPDGEGMKTSRRFNSAGDCYALALLINYLSKKDIRIKEFTQIGLYAYTDYLREKIVKEYNNNNIQFSSYWDMLKRVDRFKEKTNAYITHAYLSDASKTEPVNVKTMTLGDLICKALGGCGKSWLCGVKPLDIYRSEIIESYDMLNRLFMDAVRMPLIRSDRERFEEIIIGYGNRPFDEPVNIDFEICYEHGGIIRQ